MKSILIVTDSFLPGHKSGGPITSLSNLSSFLKDYFNTLVCTRNYDLTKQSTYTGVNFDEVVSFKGHSVIYLSKVRFFNVCLLLKRVQADVIYLNSFFSTLSIMFVVVNKLFIKAPIVMAPRGELLRNAVRLKKTKKLVYLYLYKFILLNHDVVFHSTSLEEKITLEQIFPNNETINICNIPTIYSRSNIDKQLNSLKIVFFSRISEKKNLLFCIYVLSCIDFDVSFDIYGPVDDDKYWNKCLNLMGKLPDNVHVNYHGSINHEQLHSILPLYHCLFLPTMSENYGHVIVESMQVGLIPLISNNTPWKKLQDANAGWEIDLHDVESYCNALLSIYSMNQSHFNEISLNSTNYILDKIKIGKTKQQYLELFYKMLV